MLYQNLYAEHYLTSRLIWTNHLRTLKNPQNGFFTEWIFQGYLFFSSDGWSTDQTYEAQCAARRGAMLAGGQAVSWGSPYRGDWKGAASGGGRAAKCPPRCPGRLQKIAWIWSSTLGSGGIAKITKKFLSQSSTIQHFAILCCG